MNTRSQYKYHKTNQNKRKCLLVFTFKLLTSTMHSINITEQNTNCNSQFNYSMCYKYEEIVIETCNSLDGEEGEGLVVRSQERKSVFGLSRVFEYVLWLWKSWKHDICRNDFLRQGTKRREERRRSYIYFYCLPLSETRESGKEPSMYTQNTHWKHLNRNRSIIGCIYTIDWTFVRSWIYRLKSLIVIVVISCILDCTWTIIWSASIRVDKQVSNSIIVNAFWNVNLMYYQYIRPVC